MAWPLLAGRPAGVHAGRAVLVLGPWQGARPLGGCTDRPSLPQASLMRGLAEAPGPLQEEPLPLLGFTSFSLHLSPNHTPFFMDLYFYTEVVYFTSLCLERKLHKDGCIHWPYSQLCLESGRQ